MPARHGIDERRRVKTTSGEIIHPIQTIAYDFGSVHQYCQFLGVAGDLGRIETVEQAQQCSVCAGW
jgi:hypothetical protein